MAGERRLDPDQMQFRLQRLRLMAPYYGQALVILVSTVPIGVTVWLLRAFSGKTTTLNVSIAISFSVVANVAMAGALLRRRTAMRRQRDELNRLRGRADQLERQLGTLGPGSAGTLGPGSAGQGQSE